MKRSTAIVATLLVLAGCATETQNTETAPENSPTFVRTIDLDPTIPHSIRAGDEPIHACLDLVEAEYPAGEHVNAVVDDATDSGQTIVIGEARTARLGTMLFACQTLGDGPLELVFHGTRDEW